jgi:flavorubredoxin
MRIGKMLLYIRGCIISLGGGAMETRIDEIAPDLFRLSTYVSKIDLQFNQFLVKDDEPLLYHTGLLGMFDAVRAAVAKIIDPAQLRWISFSHFEADECGSLREWLSVAPRAKPLCGVVGALVNINDCIGGRAHVLNDGETISTGGHRFRFLETPHLPHGWDASLLFEETGATLLSSDLFLQNGDLPPVTIEDVVAPARQSLLAYESGPLAHPFPYTQGTDATLQMLAGLQPELIAVMHGSSFRGDGKRALLELARMYGEVLHPAAKER